VEIEILEIQELNLKSTVNFLKLIRKVLCALTDTATAIRDVNTTEEFDYRILCPCEFGLKPG